MALINNNKFDRLYTPAFVYDEKIVLKQMEFLKEILSELKCSLLFSLKSFVFIDALRFMASYLDGFSASSLFEVQLARDIVDKNKTVHFTSPGLKEDEAISVIDLCDYISFNSISQWDRFHRNVGKKLSCGLRINPKLAFVKDERYNPCRKY